MTNKLKKLISNNSTKDVKSEEMFFVDSIELATVSYITTSMNCTSNTILYWEKKGLEKSSLSTRGLKLFDIKYLREWYAKNIDQTKSASSGDIYTEEIDNENDFSGIDLDKVPKVEAERRKEIEAVKKLMMQNKILNGENISIDDVDKNLATQAATHISHLTNSEKILPDLLENKSASDIQDILSEHNQMQIEQLFRITNKELSGEHELFDVFQKVIDKIDDGIKVEDLIEGMDKIVIS